MIGTSQHYSFDEIEKHEMDGACSNVCEGRSVYWVLVGIPEGKWQLAKTKRRLEDNIKMDLKEIGWRRGLNFSGSG